MRFDENNVNHMVDLFSKIFVCFEDELKRRDGLHLPESLSTLITIFEHWAGRLHSNTGEYGPAWAFALFKGVGQPRSATLRELHTAFADARIRLVDTVRLSSVQKTGGTKQSTSSKSTAGQSSQRTPAPAPSYAPRAHFSGSGPVYGRTTCFNCGHQCRATHSQNIPIEYRMDISIRCFSLPTLLY